MWGICKLPRKSYFILDGHFWTPSADIQALLAVHFVAKIGFQANESVTSLKLVEKGLGKDELGLAVLIDFPCQIVGGWLAARWSKGDKPLRPWLYASWVRLGFAVLWVVIVRGFPTPPISTSFFVFLVAMTVLQGFSMYVRVHTLRNSVPSIVILLFVSILSRSMAFQATFLTLPSLDDRDQRLTVYWLPVLFQDDSILRY